MMMYTSAEFMQRSKCLDATVPRDLVEKASAELVSETAAAASQEAMTVAQWAGAMLALPEMAQTALNSAGMRQLREALASISLAAQRVMADSSKPYQDVIQTIDSVVRRMPVQNPPEQQSPPTPNDENK